MYQAPIRIARNERIGVEIGMRRPQTFAILKWVGPAVLAAVYGIPQAVAQIGATFAGVKNWAESLFSAWWPTVTSTPALIIMAVLVVGYLAVLVYCGTGKPKTTKELSPICVADVLYVDLDEVTDELGVAKVDDLYSVAVCLQVSNHAPDGRTLRGLTASVYQAGLHRTRLHLRNSVNDQVDLRHGELELVEIGRVLISSEPGKSPAMSRAGGIRQPTSLPDINYAYNPDKQFQRLSISGNQPFGIGEAKNSSSTHRLEFDVVISATDTLAREVKLRLNLWAESPYEWLEIVSRGDGNV